MEPLNQEINSLITSLVFIKQNPRNIQEWEKALLRENLERILATTETVGTPLRNWEQAIVQRFYGEAEN